MSTTKKRHYNGYLICKLTKQWHDWDVHPNGKIIIVHGKLFTLNGINEETHEIYYGPWDVWRPFGRGGVAIRIGDEFFNGNGKLIYRGPCSDWRSCKEGIVIRRGSQLLLNGKTKIYDGPRDEWEINYNNGKLVIRIGISFYRDGREIYTGPWDGWGVHARGLVIRNNDSFFLEGHKLLYSGLWDGWRAHPKGVVIRQGNKWTCYML